MKAAALAAIAVIVLAFAGVASAGGPGSPYYVSETQAGNLLERTWDHAYCMGVPRFGHRGEFPYEKFIVFDCSGTMSNGKYCADVRYKSVNGRPGYWMLRLIRRGDCF